MGTRPCLAGGEGRGRGEGPPPSPSTPAVDVQRRPLTTWELLSPCGCSLGCLEGLSHQGRGAPPPAPAFSTSTPLRLQTRLPRL